MPHEGTGGQRQGSWGTKAKPLAAYRRRLCCFWLWTCNVVSWARLTRRPTPCKAQGSCKRGTYASSAVQKRTEIGALNAIALRERGLTSLALIAALTKSATSSSLSTKRSSAFHVGSDPT